jgi:thiamine-phosphate pyrophosphorylase
LNDLKNRVDFDLYLVTDRHQTGSRSLGDVVREALSGGVRAVQLREKDLPVRERFRWAERLRSVTAEFGARLLINDGVDICLAVGADGVHLRKDSLPIDAVRRIIGQDGLIGYSAHRASEALTAQQAGADFVVLGPIYDTPSKRTMGKPLGLSEIRSTAVQVSIPIFAIGGIRSGRIHPVVQNGAHGVAVISALLEAPNPRREAVTLLRELNSTRTTPTVKTAIPNSRGAY